MSIRPSAVSVKGTLATYRCNSLNRTRRSLSSALEVLDSTLVFFSLLSRTEGPKVLAPSGLRVFLSRIQPVLAGTQFPNHALLKSN
jgi:hypothetical protein